MGAMIVRCICLGNLLAQPCGGNRADIYVLVKEQLASRAPTEWYAEEASERVRLVSPEIQLLLTAKDMPRCSFFPEYVSYLAGSTAISAVDMHYMVECILWMATEELEKGDRLRSIELAEFVVQIGCDLESPRIDTGITLIGFSIQEKALGFLSERVDPSDGAEESPYYKQWQEVIQARTDLERFDQRVISATKKADVELLAKLFREAPGSVEKRTVLTLLDWRMPKGKVRDLLRTAANDKDMSVRDLASRRLEEWEPWWK
jgi:hypothetical protein